MTPFALPHRTLIRPALLSLAVLGGLLGGCSDIVPGGGPVLDPPVLIEDPAPPVSAESAALMAFYQETQDNLLTHGLLRSDDGAEDAAWDGEDLTEAFLRIAFFDEYDPALGAAVQSEAPSVLKRWDGPVRVSLEFGASVPADRQATERARVGSYLARLARVAGHPVSLTLGPRNANFVLYIGSVDERRALAPRVAEAMPGLSPALTRGITDMGRANFCLVYVDPDESGLVNARAFAVIPSELPDLMALMCLHEEMAQGLGLTNDWARARPSIFNDDSEFALLTPFDEALLRLLYAPELSPGMTADQARPIVTDLANRRTGGAS